MGWQILIIPVCCILEIVRAYAGSSWNLSKDNSKWTAPQSVTSKHMHIISGCLAIMRIDIVCMTGRVK